VIRVEVCEQLVLRCVGRRDDEASGFVDSRKAVDASDVFRGKTVGGGG
jgi:hypothetical protein